MANTILPMKGTVILTTQQFQELVDNQQLVPGTTYMVDDAPYVTESVLNNKVTECKAYADDVLANYNFIIIVPKDSALPRPGESNKIYLVAKTDNPGSTNDIFDEYIWIAQNNDYEYVASKKIDMSAYYTSAQVDEKILNSTELATVRNLLNTISSIDGTNITFKEQVSAKAFNDIDG